jgi:GNAT superfamily N-acetyltransferase
VKSGPELVDAANLSFIGSYKTLVEHCPQGDIREINGVFAFSTRLPLSLFNGCIVVGPTSPPEFEAALAWIDERGLPYRVWIDEERAPGLTGVALARGLDPDPVPYPGMVLHPVPDPPAPSSGVTVIPVTRADLSEHQGVRVEGGLPLDLARRLFPPSFAADPNVRLFSARLEGRPVGAAVAIRTGNVAGVYAVGTLPAARRRGVGTAATWAAVAAGRAWGCDTVVLQSSAMGFSMYAAMGFRTVVPYATFMRADPRR